MNPPPTNLEEVSPGLRPPPLEITPTMEDLVRWSAAADDYTTFHFDPDVARARGFEGPVVHGTYQASQIARMLTKWLGGHGRLTELACRYRRPVIVGNPLMCRAEVTAVEVEAGVQVVTLNVSAESPPGEVATTGTATARLAAPAVAPSALVTDELLAAFQIGEVIGRYTFAVSAERIRRYAGVLDDLSLEDSLVHRDDLAERYSKAPATFFAALDPLELKLMSHDRGLDLLPHRRTGGGNAFNEIEYDRPIRAGDVITVEVAYTEIYEKQGRSGPLLFRVRRNVLTDAAGERVATAHSAHVYAFEVPGYEPPDRTGRAAANADDGDLGEELPPLVRIPTTETLVRYAAAADDYAPLHFDQDYARTRGYDTVIVHGFLKAGYMDALLASWAGPDAFVKRFRAEYRGPDYPGHPITARGRVIRSFETGGRDAAEVELWTERADGSISTRGAATVVFPSGSR